MLSPHEKRDKLIRATDLDALSCRYSANAKSYFKPPDPYIGYLISSYQQYLQYCSGYSSLSSSRTLRSIFKEQKFPLINRGTYLRTEIIKKVLNTFIQENPKCQVISLGGGSDTKCFEILKHETAVHYLEVDFPESVKIKKLSILKNPELKHIVKCSDDFPTINSKEEFVSYESDMHTGNYTLLGLDLRDLKNDIFKERLQKAIDSTLPTLVLSECALCYVSSKENELIISSFKDIFNDKAMLSFLIYEPLSLNDSFGSTMMKNLSNRGIDLPTFDDFPTLESRRHFLKDICGLSNVKLTNMSFVGGYECSKDESISWMEKTELDRINRLELIDEIEEIRLLFRHYCLCYAEYSNGDTFKGIDSWPWLES